MQGAQNLKIVIVCFRHLRWLSWNPDESGTCPRNVDRGRLFGSITIQHFIDPIHQQEDPNEVLGALLSIS